MFGAKSTTNLRKLSTKIDIGASIGADDNVAIDFAAAGDLSRIGLRVDGGGRVITTYTERTCCSWS